VKFGTGCDQLLKLSVLGEPHLSEIAIA